MIVISHRGFWKTQDEKNQGVAFERSFSAGFGTETDLRDFNGSLVISHDMPGPSALPADSFFELYKRSAFELPLALNIKADGLQAQLQGLLVRYEVEDYFVFDMSVPDGLIYCRLGLKTFTRQSEYEQVPAFYELAAGVWLDELTSHWITGEIIESHLRNGKRICIVSPELHRRNHEHSWAHYKKLEARIGKNKLMLCTDLPDLAREYFNE
jgi:hypothetical protein